MPLEITEKNDCSWDLVSLGEVLLRFCPGKARIREASSFEIFDGGDEYNVARNLARVFGLKTAISTALAENELGALAENLVRAGGVDTSQILWRNGARNGIYFIERGFGRRAPASCFDRTETAVSQLQKG